MPVLLFGKFEIGAEQFAGEERRFVTARGRLDFHDDVLGVVRVGRQERDLNLPLQLFRLRLEIGDVGGNELAQFRIAFAGKHFAVFRHLVERAGPGIEFFKEGLELPVLAGDPAALVGLRIDRRIGQSGFQFAAAHPQFFDISGDIFRYHVSRIRLR